MAADVSVWDCTCDDGEEASGYTEVFSFAWPGVHHGEYFGVAVDRVSDSSVVVDSSPYRGIFINVVYKYIADYPKT